MSDSGEVREWQPSAAVMGTGREEADRIPAGDPPPRGCGHSLDPAAAPVRARGAHYRELPLLET